MAMDFPDRPRVERRFTQPATASRWSIRRGSAPMSLMSLARVAR